MELSDRTPYDDPDEYGVYEGECAGCLVFTRLGDSGLCSDCSARLDRDLIRERAWGYSSSAFGVPPAKREELRSRVVAEYGESMELIEPRAKRKPPKPRRRRKRKR